MRSSLTRHYRGDNSCTTSFSLDLHFIFFIFVLSVLVRHDVGVSIKVTWLLVCYATMVSSNNMMDCRRVRFIPNHSSAANWYYRKSEMHVAVNGVILAAREIFATKRLYA